MDQIKIGKFIAFCRKSQSLTQAQLAEKLDITDRAISKWETGKSMPDSSIMLKLCDILKITVNELLKGERVDMKEYYKAAEENLLQMKRQEEEINRKLLHLEAVVGYTCSAAFLIMIFAAGFAVESLIWRVILIAAAAVIFLVGIVYALKIEREAGYYLCGECGHRYVPSGAAHYWAMHMGRTRYMKCPECGKWSWSKKVLGK